MRAAQISGEVRVHLELAFQAIGQAVECQRCIATGEVVALVATALGGGIGVHAEQRARQLQFVLQRFIAAQARADHQHGVAGLVELLHRLVQVEGTQRAGIVFCHDAAALRAGDHAKAQRQQALDLRAGVACAAAQPQQRALCL